MSDMDDFEHLRPSSARNRGGRGESWATKAGHAMQRKRPQSTSGGKEGRAGSGGGGERLGEEQGEIKQLTAEEMEDINWPKSGACCFFKDAAWGLRGGCGVGVSDSAW